MKRIYLPLLILPLLIAACDNNGGSNTGGTSFRISSAALPTAALDVPYTFQFSTENGTDPVTFAWGSGFTPPAWLALSPAGELTGTPNAIGTVDLQLQATDSNAPPRTAIRTVTLNVVGTPAILTTELPRAVKGSAWSHQIAVNVPAGLTASLALHGTLPAGVTFNAGTRTLSGTPTVPGLFELEAELLLGTASVQTVALDLVVYESIPFTYYEDPNKGVDGDTRSTGTQLGTINASTGYTQSEQLTLNPNLNSINPAPDPEDWFRFNTASRGTIIIEVFYRELVGSLNARLDYYSLATHSLTEFMGRSETFGDDERIVLHDAPQGFYYLCVWAPPTTTPNAYTFRITFTDLAITDEHFEADVAGGPIDIAVPATNQGAPVNGAEWSLVGGMLPAGVSFTVDGRFEGTPTEFGLRTFTVRVTENGQSVDREVRVRFFDSNVGDYWQLRGERRLYDPLNNDPLKLTYGDAMVVAPHPEYGPEGAIYVLGGRDSATLAGVRVFHTDAPSNTDKHFKFEDIGKDMITARRYHGAAFIQHSYGGYIYVVGGEVGAGPGGHAEGDFWYGVERLQVADGNGDPLAHPLTTNWEQLADLPRDEAGRDIKGWAEFGLVANDAALDADDRIYLIAGRYQIEATASSGTYERQFHTHVLMFEPPTSGGGTGTWTVKNGSGTYTPVRYPAAAMLDGKIYLVGGREGTAGQSGTGGSPVGTIQMYEPNPTGAAPALSTGGTSQYQQLTEGVYYPMSGVLNGQLYVWCGWDTNVAGTKRLHRFDPVTGDVVRLTDADWGTGFGPGVVHNGRLWLLSGIGHGVTTQPMNLVYIP